MKVEVKKIDALSRELTFKVPRDRVDQKFDEVYKTIGRNASIKGFRKGKAPRKMLEKVHGDLAREEMLKGLIPEIYQQGVVEQELDPIDLPEISGVDLKEDGLSFKATLDIKPTVTIKEYKGLKLKKVSTNVTDKDVEKTLEVFKQTPGKDKDQKVEMDDAFAQKMGFKTLDEFKEALKKQLAFDKQRQASVEEEEQIVEKLLKNVKMDVPQSLVKRQVYSRMEHMVKMMSQQGMKEDEIKGKLEESKKELEQAAEKDVRVFLALQEIAKIEKIDVQEGEHLAQKVMTFLRNEANWEAKK